MGQFSYLCRGCGQSIRVGELAVLRHVRSGEVLGEVTGHYDGYGRVREDPRGFNGDHPGLNGRDEINISEFELEDSKEGLPGGHRLVNGKLMDVGDLMAETNVTGLLEIIDRVLETDDPADVKAAQDLVNQARVLTAEFRDAPVVKNEPASGLSCWHKLCFDKAVVPNLRPSDRDHTQGSGKPRRRFT